MPEERTAAMAEQTTDAATATTTETTTTETTQTDALPNGLNDAGKEAIRKEREARRAAEKQAKEMGDRLATLENAANAAAADKAKADEEAAAKRGEFEQIATKRGEELKTTAQERDALAARVEAYETAEQTRFDARFNDLPDDIKASDPGRFYSDTPLSARLKWLDEVAMPEAAKRTTSGALRVPSAPNGRTPTVAEATEQLKREARATGVYSSF